MANCTSSTLKTLLPRRAVTKVESCCKAVNEGVKKVFIIDGRVKHSILIELLTDEGMGTMFRRAEN